MTVLERARARTPITWLTVIGLLLLPVVIGGVLIAALHSPTDRLENMTAAVVNDDEPVTVDGQYTPLGRELAAGLVEGADDEDSSNLTWVVSNDDDAANGLADGTYQAVVTIPENFSAAAMSPAENLSGDGTTPEQARIDVETAPDALIVDQAITSQLADVATGSMGDTLSEGVLSNLLVGFSTMGDQLGDAADGAQQLADGAGEAQDGAGDLADGADQVADGVGQLGNGLDQLADGAGSASAGAQELAGGAQDLADGVPALTDGANGLADGAAGLKGGLDQLDAGVNGVAGDPGLVGGAQQLASGLQTAVDGIRSTDLVPNELAQASAGAAEGTRGIADGLAALSQQCALAAAPAFCDQLDQLTANAEPTAQAAAGVQQGLTGINDTAPGTIADQLGDAVTGAQQLAGGTRQLGDGIPQLADGAGQLAAGASQLADGTDQLAGGASALADGASGLADGVGQLTTGLGQAAANVPQLEDGATQVADGVVSLGDGIGELEDGAGELADGLGEAVDSVPSYGDQEAEDLASVVANPVTASSGTSLFGAASIPLLVVAVLWFGALATFFVLRAVSAQALTSRRPSAFLAAGSLLPAAAIGAVQGALVAGIVQIVAGYDSGVFWGLLGMSVLAGVAFAAIHQALVAVFGGVGRWIAGIVGALTVAISIVSTIPNALTAVRDVLPTVPAFDGMLAIIAESTGAGSAAISLVVWAVLAFVVTMIAVATRRTVKTKALLKPSLA
ncbi:MULTISPECIES: YhgE/Pip domain-containing protein [unclassified Microbacterium]|uniref:YhgE/Pip domain-containing protein n=1 Tax=unclassified Microbacterium TaxID=2609290 RepID=UPI00097F3C2D|nr:YhgE/Pip domain-containing protein [Microbacterium sp. JB110]RCS57854.1 YhgE/Pip domain-containing protein [Microbacterium sp. JB110]SJM56774.1 Putative membrane protein MmpL10 [Frigoribacterium sp. JB110]